MSKRLRQHLHGLWLDYGPGWPAFLVLAGLSALLIWYRLDSYTVSATERAAVIGLTRISDETGYIAHLNVTLPDGTPVHVVTRAAGILAQLDGTACIDVRAHRSGRTTYALALKQDC